MVYIEFDDTMPIFFTTTHSNNVGKLLPLPKNICLASPNHFILLSHTHTNPPPPPPPGQKKTFFVCNDFKGCAGYKQLHNFLHFV